MRVCYVDESGDTGVLTHATAKIQPVLVVAGVSLLAEDLAGTTNEFLRLKRRFFPGLHGPGRAVLDGVLAEVKGSELRKLATSVSRRKRRTALGYLHGIVDLLMQRDARIFGRVWVKGIASPINSRSIYTSSLQSICRDFQTLLASENKRGIVIADGREKRQNAQVAHSVFTQKFQRDGDAFSRILEMPTFGHSENHAGLQIADVISSALVCPIAAYTYCTGYVTNMHVCPEYAELKRLFGRDLEWLQFRYQRDGRWRGGLTVDDRLGRRTGGLLFQRP